MENLMNVASAVMASDNLADQLQEFASDTQIAKVLTALDEIKDVKKLNAVGWLLKIRMQNMGENEEPMFTNGVPDSLKARPGKEHNLNWFNSGGG
jgi:hypothetical protein